MANVIKGIAKTKVGQVNIQDLAIAGASKYIFEKLLEKYIGNSSLFSGAVKLGVGAWLLPKVLGNNAWSKNIALGIGIDGIEDITVSLLAPTLNQMLGAFGMSNQTGGIIV